MMGNMEQEQYYIVTEDGKTEGPYSFESLETFYTEGKINDDTLVCIAGGQEWVQFWTILEQERKKEVQPCEESKKQALERLMNEYDPIPEDQPAKKSQEEAKPLEITVEGLFRLTGVLALITGVILALCNTGPGHAAIGIIYLLSGAFSCLGCFWCAKVIELLSYANRLLLVIAKKTNNSSDKKNCFL